MNAGSMRTHLTEQDAYWRDHSRDTANPTWDDLTPEEQLIEDEGRYLIENGDIAFYVEDEA